MRADNQGEGGTRPPRGGLFVSAALPLCRNDNSVGMGNRRSCCSEFTCLPPKPQPLAGFFFAVDFRRRKAPGTTSTGASCVLVGAKGGCSFHKIAAQFGFATGRSVARAVSRLIFCNEEHSFGVEWRTQKRTSVHHIGTTAPWAPARPGTRRRRRSQKSG